jgi:uncharacterized protein
MADEKDRFGDKLREKERADEDRYFAERDRAVLERLRATKGESDEAALRQIARGRCPKCGSALAAMQMDGVAIDRCPDCRGLWLDEGELESLSRRESEGWLGRLFRQRIEEIR